MKEHGATEVIDYTKDDVVKYFSDEDDNIKDDNKFDIVYDAATNSGAGEDYKDKSIRLLKDEGQYVAINGSPSMWLRLVSLVSLKLFLNFDHFVELLQLVTRKINISSS